MNSTTSTNGHRCIRVVPALPCIACTRLTSIALINVPNFAQPFLPVCPMHGYPFQAGSEPTPYEMSMQQEAAARFVNWMYDGQANVTLVSEVHELLSIPGYSPLKDEEEEGLTRAWYCGFQKPDGTKREVHILLRHEPHMQYYLLSDRRLYRDRSIFWLEIA